MRSESDCPDQQDLRRLMLGQLTDTDAEILERHLTGCARCDGLVDELSTDDVLTSDMRVPSPILEGTVNPGVQRLIGRLRHLYPRDGGPSLSASTAPEATLLEPPQEPGEIGRLGPYRVLKVLGWGGMAVVYQAWQERPRRLVALKMIQAPGQASPQRLARFRGETEIIARLAHPNIVPIYEAGEHAGQPFFAMEYLGGGSLAQQLTAPLPARSAAVLLQTLAGAVAFAHERGVVHRDLKPSNVLLTADGVPKISDFGLARQFAGDDGPAEYRTASGAILGTPGYMAPEQAGSGAVGPAADVYALGAILYECLTGRPPFQAATVLETLERARTREPVPPGTLQPGLPRDLQTICLTCLHKEPQKRYASARDLADDLGRFLRGEPISARPVSRLERLIKWAKRRPALAVLAGVCLLALAGLVIGAAVYERRLRDALRETTAERERADAHYRDARDKLNHIVARFEDRRVADVPRLKELRRDVLEDVLAFYQEALKEADSTRLAVRFDTAVAYEQAGLLQAALGRRQPAEENLRRAGELFERLAAESPDDAEVTAHLAGCLARRGLLCCERAGPGVYAVKETLAPAERTALEEAEALLERALHLREALARAHPGNRRWKEALADSHRDLATALFLARKRDGAEAHNQQTLALRSEVLAGDPTNPAAISALAQGYIHVAGSLSTHHPISEVEPLYQRAETLLRPLVRDAPQESEHALLLANVYQSWANLLRSDPKSPVEPILDLYGRSIRLLPAVLEREPHDTRARQVLLSAHGGRAYLYAGLKRYAEAMKDWDRVIELDDAGPASRAFSRACRAGVFARAGEHARAAAEAGALVENPEGSDDVLYNAAAAYAMAQVAALADARLSATERQAVADGYAARAVAALRKLKEAGYFRIAEHRSYLDALESLCGRDDFQQLLREVDDRRDKGSR